MLAEATAAEETPGTYVPPGPLALFPMPQVHAAGLAPADANSISMMEAAAMAGASGDMKATALVAAAGGSRVAGLPGAAIAAVSVAAAANSSSTDVSTSGVMNSTSGVAAAPPPAATTGMGATSAAANEAAAAAAVTAAKKRTVVTDNLHVYRLTMGLPVRTVACGALHTLVALEGGGVLGWGDNASGQATGRAGIPSVRMGAPTRIVDFEGVDVVCLSAGKAQAEGHNVELL